MTIALPPPDAAAQAHSDRLATQLRDEIASNGPMPFSRWMERCLYAPGLGYYSAGLTKFGTAGDFVTAPELGPLFARCVVQSLLPGLRPSIPNRRFLELGGGSGAFAVDALTELARLDALPDEYAILEPSADLRERQRARVEADLPADVGARVRWLDTPPDQSWQGVLFANEVIDALPATRFTLRDGEVHEEFVAVDSDRFVIIDRPADSRISAAVRELEHALGRPFADGYRSELLPQLHYWMQAICGTLQSGLVLFVDYGYTRREYYQPDRSDGTLACHYRHRMHGNALLLPGLQDITASVDFSAVAEAGRVVQLLPIAYASQAQFLLANGLADQHQRSAADPAVDALALYRLSGQIKRLTMPDQMGERFQAMLFAKDMQNSDLPDYSDIDRSRQL